MKAKAFLLTLFLSVAAVSLWAQDKYDFLIVKNAGTKPSARILIYSKEKVETIPLDKIDDESAIVELLKKLDELQASGWEVITVNRHYEQTIYYLRRKKN